MTNHAFKAGESRHQACLLPPGIEDYVGPDNPVRAIESFVCALDLAKFGFRHAERGSEEVGQPPYDPADLLKLYLYGYINQVRLASAGEGSLAESGIDLAVKEPAARLSDDCQLPHGELDGAEGGEPPLLAGDACAWRCRRQRCCD
jgi:hypothetical protein